MRKTAARMSAGTSAVMAVTGLLAASVGLAGLTAAPAFAEVATNPCTGNTTVPVLTSFTGGDVVVEQVGSGTAALTHAGNIVCLDELSTAGALQGTFEVTQDPSSFPQFQESGTATYDGELTLSGDGTHIVVPGYDVPSGNTSSLTGTSSTAVPRMVASVSLSGGVDLSTAVTDFASAQNYRGVTSADGTSKFWLSGNAVSSGNGGIAEAADGATTSTEIYGAGAGGSGEVLDYNGNLYVVSKTSGEGLTVGELSGLPTAAATPTALNGFPTSTSASGPVDSPVSIFPVQLDSSGTANPDTIYLTDDTLKAPGSSYDGEIQKWSLVSGTWTETGVIACNTCRGLTGAVNKDGSVTLFATSSDTNGGATSTSGYLFSYTDSSGYDVAPASDAAASLLYTAPTDEAFRGVVYLPTSVGVDTPEVPWAPLLPIAAIATLGSAYVMVRRRRGATAG